MLLRQEGYVVRNAPSRKYVTVLPPGGKRAIRLDSLGDGYTEQDIRRRLAAQREGSTLATHTFTHTGRRYRIKGRRPTGTQRKIGQKNCTMEDQCCTAGDLSLTA